MPFLGAEDLKKLLTNDIINPYRIERIKQAAYELSLGNEVYRTDAKDRKIETLNSTNRTVEINPGQFTLLLTEETVSIPSDKLAFISIKAKEKLKGLINVSGFHVDPGFKGKLLFSVYNAGPSTITLEMNKPYFLIWFSSLQTPLKGDELYNSISNSHQNQNGIRAEYIDALKRGELASPSALLEKLRRNEESLKTISWAAGILISLCIAINVKIYTEDRGFKKGIELAESANAIKEEINKEAKDMQVSPLFLTKVDSLINAKLLKKASHQ